MSTQPPMYEVLWSRGSGTHSGPRFRHYADALRYALQHRGEASFALRFPDGHAEPVIQRRGGTDPRR